MAELGSNNSAGFNPYMTGPDGRPTGVGIFGESLKNKLNGSGAFASHSEGLRNDQLINEIRVNNDMIATNFNDPSLPQMTQTPNPKQYIVEQAKQILSDEPSKGSRDASPPQLQPPPKHANRGMALDFATLVKAKTRIPDENMVSSDVEKAKKIIDKQPTRKLIIYGVMGIMLVIVIKFLIK